MPFAENLRNELDYQDIIVKQLAAKTGVNIHTLNHYLSGKKSMPPADVAVKIALALGVSVEYLVTGRESPPRSVNGRKRAAARERDGTEETPDGGYRPLVDKLRLMPENVRDSIMAMIDAVAGCGRSGKRAPGVRS